MPESSSCSLSSRVCQYTMDVQHRKCNREHEVIPEAPQTRCIAADPLPAQPDGKLETTTTFWRRGMCLVHQGNSATLHLSVLDRCPCSQNSPSVRICFFPPLFHRFYQWDCQLSKCPNSWIFRWSWGENGFKF